MWEINAKMTPKRSGNGPKIKPKSMKRWRGGEERGGKGKESRGKERTGEVRGGKEKKGRQKGEAAMRQPDSANWGEA